MWRTTASSQIVAVVDKIVRCGVSHAFSLTYHFESCQRLLGVETYGLVWLSAVPKPGLLGLLQLRRGEHPGVRDGDAPAGAIGALEDQSLRGGLNLHVAGTHYDLIWGRGRGVLADRNGARMRGIRAGPEGHRPASFCRSVEPDRDG